ncbi:MAG: nuclear transport factor 2 family protein [Alloacidobacterium sp.]
MFLLPLTFFFSTLPSTGQTSKRPDALFETIKSLDAKLFDAYNHCNLETLGSMVSDDLEFFHDQTGLTVGKAPFLAAIKQNICGKIQRSLLEETLEVYPLGVRSGRNRNSSIPSSQPARQCWRRQVRVNLA